jgi:hypothetical protein
MQYSFFYHVPISLVAIVFLLLNILFNWMGYRFKKNQLSKHPEEESSWLGTAGGSLLGLTALVLSFSFGMTESRFENRRDLIVQEANDIGTAILRCDLYPDSVRKLFMEDFKEYVDTRVLYYEVGDDETKILNALKEASHYSGRIWKRAVDLSQNLDNRVRTAQMIPALNTMIDIVTTRELGRLGVVPRIVLWILASLIFASAFLVGYGTNGKKRHLIFVIAFVLMTAMAFYLVIELDRPRKGFINLDIAEQQITNLKSMFIESK